MENLKLLDTPVIIVPGMEEAEIDELWECHVIRVRMTAAFLEGKIDAETYLDFMTESGYEPEELLEIAEANLEFAINEGIVIQ